MTTAERKHRSLARRLAREYVRSGAGVDSVMFVVDHRWFYVGDSKVMVAELGLALATLVEREVERAMRKGRKA